MRNFFAKEMTAETQYVNWKIKQAYYLQCFFASRGLGESRGESMMSKIA